MSDSRVEENESLDETILDEELDKEMSSTPIPEIPLDAEEDPDPLAPAETVSAGADPDIAHNHKMEDLKLKFAIKVVITCIAIVVGLTVLQFLTQNYLKDSSGLSSAISWSQGLAATAAGFAFGRAVSVSKVAIKE